jgi:very-short-patch-repair endonuclease
MMSDIGVTHDHIRNEVAAGRWLPVGLQSICVHRGELGLEALRHVAVWETGVHIAALDGVTALAAAGLTGYVDERIHLSVKHTHNIRQLPGVRLHKVIRRIDGEVMPTSPPRVRPAIAAVRAAGWAVSDRQAALVLLMTAQQRLASPAALFEAVGLCLGRRRRGFIRRVVADIALGVQSLGELDFARLCRARGLPEPSRQVVRHGPGGRMYLDVRWDKQRLVVEVDGVQHRQGLAVSVDNLSRNAVTLTADRVLRIDLVGLRLHEDEFMHQVAVGLATSATRSR